MYRETAGLPAEQPAEATKEGGSRGTAKKEKVLSPDDTLRKVLAASKEMAMAYVDELTADDIASRVAMDYHERTQKEPGFKLANRDGYVWKATCRLLVRYNKSQKRRDAREEEYSTELVEQDRPWMEADRTPEVNERIQLLRRVMAELPPKRREIFTQAKLAGKSRKQLAKEFKISTETVKDHISKANEAIREAFAQHEAGKRPARDL